jgi:hypothetical protein
MLRMAPRAGLGSAIRLGELTAIQDVLPDPLATLAGLEFPLPAHGSAARAILLRVDQMPGASMALRVQGTTELGVVVLGNPSFEIRGLAYVGLAFRIEQDVDVERHGNPRVDSGSP